MSSLSVAAGAATAESLVAAYAPGATYFASPRGTLLAGPRVERLDAPSAGGSAAAAEAALVRAGSPASVVAGLLPFDPAGAPHLALAPAPLRASPGPVRGLIPRLVLPEPRRTPWPDEAGYAAAVERALRLIDAGKLDKVVLARTLLLEYPDAEYPIDIRALLRRLAAADAHGYIFATGLPGQGRRALVGASPELLIAKHGELVESWPLAGSLPRGPGPGDDAERCAALSASDKDLREHAYVVQAVADALAPYCRSLTVPSRPGLTATGAMWHLGTRIRGVLRDPGVSSLELLAALHPTPAVCGAPRPAALAAIGELEPFDRGYYAGAVGWCDASGDGEWALAIRCAEVAERGVRLFAGAGVVAGSDPRAEAAETGAKFRTMLAALGVEPAAGPAGRAAAHPAAART